MKCYRCGTVLPQSDPGDTVRCDICSSRTKVPEKQSFFRLMAAYYAEHKVAIWFMVALLAIMYFAVDKNPAEAVVLVASLCLFSSTRKWHVLQLRKSIPQQYPDAKDSRLVKWIIHNSLFLHCLKTLAVSLLLILVFAGIGGKQEKGSTLDRAMFYCSMGSLVFFFLNTPRVLYHGCLAWFYRRKLDNDELCEKHKKEIY